MNNMIMSRFMLAVLFQCLFLKTNICLGDDTISANESLSGDQTIVSAGRVFELGFFKPGKPSNYYIGMWYKQVTPRIVVWVANREKPVLDRFSSELKISDGNLVLFDESKIPIWSTNRSLISSSAVKAVLLDDGNFVLKDGLNMSKPLWQSFDHPTDTWLAGSKFGFNKRTKTKNILTSWKNTEDPSPGLFSLELDLNENSYVVLWNRSRRYWTSGPWNGRIFDSVPEMNGQKNSNFYFVSNENESYFIYFAESSSTISREVMDVSGQMNYLVSLPTGWTVISSFPRQQCQVHALCGAYGSCNENSLPFCRCLWGFEPKSQSDWALKDYSSGCIRKTKLQCADENPTNSKTDRFLEMSSVSLPINKEYVLVDSMVDCASTCLNNCSCTAFAYDNNGCSIWMGDLLNLKQLGADDSSGRTLHVRLAASQLPRPNKRKKITTGVLVGSAAGITIVIGLIIVVVIFRQRRKIAGTIKALQDSLVAFEYRDLQNATKNFMEKLGGGGFGSVFKGILADSTIVAVKKLEGVGQGEKQFRAEVNTIGTIQHVNLVRLRGFCSQGTKRLLVYDYMSNGSLASQLFNLNKSNVLDWKTRYQIALGTARGLVYLHEKCRYCIIHCDIKPENVLLDGEFSPKVADFGLAKLLGREFNRVLTTMRGTRGYLAPEWIAGVAITSKADVYSFGMMLFELVSGRRNSEQTESNERFKYFPSMATAIVVQGSDVLSVLDGRLEGNADIEEVERVCKVACWCIQDNEAHRPSMSQVVQMLEGIIEVDLPPVPGYLHFFDDDDEENVVFFPK